jgi:phosphoserine phosphatase
VRFFKTVILDVDSTLCGIEGIDWLAARRSPSVVADVTRLTSSAMNGEVSLETVYSRRLALVAPTREDIAALEMEYTRRIAPGALDAISAMKAAGVDVHLISGGLRPALTAVARSAGIDDDDDVHAVAITFSDDGSYSSFEKDSPLTKQFGKRDVIASLNLERPSLMVGDGITDAEVRPAVDAFAAFTGFAWRPTVVAQADYVVRSFDELRRFTS